MAFRWRADNGQRMFARSIHAHLLAVKVEAVRFVPGQIKLKRTTISGRSYLVFITGEKRWWQDVWYPGCHSFRGFNVSTFQIFNLVITNY